MKKEERSQLLKVGIFLSATILIVFIIVFILGRTRSLFSDKIHVHTYFDNVNGLILGAPVRLSGFEIGIVQSIRFTTDFSAEEERCAILDPKTQNPKLIDSGGKRPKVYIEMNIQKEYLQYIRKDSFAQLASKGLLGDAVIDITVGDLENGQVKNGACLQSEKPMTLTEVADLAQKTIGNVNGLIGDAKTLLGSANGVLVDTDLQLKKLLTDELAHDFHRSMKMIASVMEGVEHGNGLLHSMIYDKRLSKDVEGLLSNGRQSMRILRDSLAKLNHILRQVKTGPGTMHSLFYQKQGASLLSDLGHSVKEVDAILSEVRSGSGLVHSLVYEKDTSHLVENLGETAETLRTLMSEIDQGKGTIGGLIKDPSVYKSVKRIVKNAQGTIEDSKVLTWVLQYLNKDNRPAECRAD